MAIINGTNNNDTLTGGNGPDTINGKGGDDSLIGGGGDDIITGGDGLDTVSGGAGNDKITIGRGDTIHGDDGNDILTFVDVATGIQTNIAGDIGTDKLTLDFSGATDSLSSNNDNVGDGSMMGVNYSGIESLVILGGSASDLLVGGSGNDTLTGGAGNDRLDGRAGVNIIDGGAGNDIGLVDVSSAKTARIVTFVSGTDLVIGGDTLTNIEGRGRQPGRRHRQ
jgi:Ca2+-binding RTX toxin-like protein